MVMLARHLSQDFSLSLSLSLSTITVLDQTKQPEGEVVRIETCDILIETTQTSFLRLVAIDERSQMIEIR